MNLRKQTMLYVALTLSLCLVQSNTSPAQNLDTRKGYDLRGYGFDSAARFINRYAEQLPIVIGVSTQDLHFIKEIKSIIREFDVEGYENIVLIIYDQLSPNTNPLETHEITFYLNSEPVTTICKVAGKWGIIFINDASKMDMEGMMLINCKTEYPVTLIKTKFKTLFRDHKT